MPESRNNFAGGELHGETPGIVAETQPLAGEPAGVILDSANRVSYFFGDTSPFLSTPRGSPDWNLLSLVQVGLDTCVRDLVLAVRRTGAGQRTMAWVKGEGQFRLLAMTAAPVTANRWSGLLLSFAWADRPTGTVYDGVRPQAELLTPISDEEKRLLLQRFGLLRPAPVRSRHMDPIPGELQGAHEELQAANEELQAANEELRSHSERDERQKLVIAELRHRIKNLLNTVQAIAMQTLRVSPSLDSFQEAFLPRIQTLSACHDLLVQSGWRSAPLKELIDGSLRAHLREGLDRLDNDTDGLALPPGAAQALVMVLHELATNAVKYGGLSAADRRLAVCCHREAEDGPVQLVWSETGGQGLAAPEHKGFGVRLIESSVRSELNGKISWDYRPEGLRVEFTFPLPPPED